MVLRTLLFSATASSQGFTVVVPTPVSSVSCSLIIAPRLQAGLWHPALCVLQPPSASVAPVETIHPIVIQIIHHAVPSSPGQPAKLLSGDSTPLTCCLYLKTQVHVSPFCAINHFFQRACEECDILSCPTSKSIECLSRREGS